MKQLTVINSIEITKFNCKVDGKPLQTVENNTVLDFLKELYQLSEMKYSKFHKMDVLSKSAILGSHFISNKIPENETPTVMLFNEKSSMQSDLNHIEQYSESIASPATFVYTLPNICVGEICIKNNWKSPTSFLVMPKEYFQNYTKMVMMTMLKNNSSFAICGYVDVTDEEINVAMALVKIENKNKNKDLDSFFQGFFKM